MRYLKGSIAISAEQDYPLLKQVLACKFVTQTQLWRLMRHSHHEDNRRSFDWRIKRLSDHGFVSRISMPAIGTDYVYAIARQGITYLQTCGEFYSGPESGPAVEPDINGVAHAVGLTEIQLRFLDAGVLAAWQTETEIRSQNELTATGYAKDYDAVATLVLGVQARRFALEYERTAKAHRAYVRIREMIESERQIERFLYLVTNRHIESFLTQIFWRTTQRVYIGFAGDLGTRPPEQVTVIDTRNLRRIALADID